MRDTNRSSDGILLLLRTQIEIVMEDYCYCSRTEAQYRQQTGDIHVLETTDETKTKSVKHRVADKRRVVKKFVRSGSSDLHKSYAPRTLDQLDATVTYLLIDVWSDARNQGDDLLPILYAFVMDRLQAVRQDIITEGHFAADPLVVVSLFEMMVRFYVQSMHVVMGVYSNKRRSATPTPAAAPTSAPAPAPTHAHAPAHASAPRASPVSPPLSTWFDLHLHESSLSSCISTCQAFCSQSVLPRHVSSHARLSAYAALLTAASALRDAFQCIYTAGGAGGAGGAGCAGGDLLSPPHQWLKIIPVGNVTSSVSLTVPTTTNAKESACVGGEAGGGERTRPATATERVVAAVYRCISCLRQHNPAGAVAAFQTALSDDDDDGDDDDDDDCGGVSSGVGRASSGSGSSSSSGGSGRLVLSALLWHMLPELRLWRLLLMDGAANKDESVDAVSTVGRTEGWGRERKGVKIAVNDG